MAMTYSKLKNSFRRHPKMRLIKEIYADAPINERPNDIRVAIENLWSYCMESCQDGVLRMSERKIELIAEWEGSRGKLIEIITNEETTFLDKNKDGTYSLHNWFNHNGHLKPERQAEVSEQKTKAANIRWLKDNLERLKLQKVSVDDCDWLYIENDTLKVELIKLPQRLYLKIGKHEFYKKSGFDEYFSNLTEKKARGVALGEIKKHTKRCGKCKKICINYESNICSKCGGY